MNHRRLQLSRSERKIEWTRLSMGLFNIMSVIKACYENGDRRNLVHPNLHVRKRAVSFARQPAFTGLNDGHGLLLYARPSQLF